jgi:hypothetical protein
MFALHACMQGVDRENRQRLRSNLTALFVEDPPFTAHESARLRRTSNYLKLRSNQAVFYYPSKYAARLDHNHHM